MESRLTPVTDHTLARPVLRTEGVVDTAPHGLPVWFQNKDLKSRIIHLEGSYRSSKEGLVVQMEARIAELEDRLESEER